MSNKAEQVMAPASPIGEIELTDGQLETIYGGYWHNEHRSGEHRSGERRRGDSDDHRWWEQGRRNYRWDRR